MPVEDALAALKAGAARSGGVNANKRHSGGRPAPGPGPPAQRQREVRMWRVGVVCVHWALRATTALGRE